MHKLPTFARRSLVLLFSLLLTACVGQPARPVETASYDFGNLAGPWHSPGFSLAAVEVRASSWLASTAQLYRLDYDDPLRRRAYTRSRWAAPPAELLERALYRRAVFGSPDSSAPGCRLALTLDEFEQRFDTAQTSRLVLEVRARLLPVRSEALLARRAFTIHGAAPSADARGSAAAAGHVVDTLTGELSAWLAEVARERPEAVLHCQRVGRQAQEPLS